MRMILSGAFIGLTVSSVFAQQAVNTELAPRAELRVAMIGVNPVLVSKMPDGTVAGISIDLGNFIAAKLGVKLIPVVYASPEAYTQSFGEGEWDIAIGPRRASDADKVDFSPDFMLVDNIYVAASGRRFADASEVDRRGVRVAVARGGAPDKFLTKSLKSAKILRVPGRVDDAVEALRSGQADVYGSNGEFVYAVLEKLAGSTIVPGAFATVHMSVLLPKGRSAAAQNQVAQFVKEAMAQGLPRRAVERQALKGVRPLNN